MFPPESFFVVNSTTTSSPSRARCRGRSLRRYYPESSSSDVFSDAIEREIDRATRTTRGCGENLIRHRARAPSTLVHRSSSTLNVYGCKVPFAFRSVGSVYGRHHL